MSDDTLYQRLGGYDGISAFANDLLPRLQSDERLSRFWENRGSDGIAREKQLLIDYLSHNAGGPLYYTGRDMLKTHRGMGITELDWENFLTHASATMAALNIAPQECQDVTAFVLSLKTDIVGV